MSSYLILSIIVIIILTGLFNKVNCFESFLIGAKSGLKTSVNMYSNLLVFLVAVTFLMSSGLIEYISLKLNFEYSLVFVQMIIRPLSASSSMSILVTIYDNYGVDSTMAILSTMIHYVSDASLYIIPFYCGLYNYKQYDKIMLIGIIVNIFSYLVSIIIIFLIYK